MLDVSRYPQCARILRFQQANLNDPLMGYWHAAVCVASAQSDARMTEFGGFDFDDKSDANGKKQLARLEAFLSDKSQRTASNYAFASEGLKALLGSRGVKVSALKSEDDYWAVAETLFPGHIKRSGGFASLYVQIQSIPKKTRGNLARANLGLVPAGWLGKITERRPELARTAA